MSSVNNANRVKKKPNSRQWQRHSLYRGMQARIARALGVTRTAVCLVMSGERASARISKAIDKEIARIEREIAKGEERAA